MNIILVIVLSKAVVSIFCIRLVFYLYRDENNMKSYRNKSGGIEEPLVDAPGS